MLSYLNRHRHHASQHYLKSQEGQIDLNELTANLTTDAGKVINTIKGMEKNNRWLKETGEDYQIKVEALEFCKCVQEKI